jgi:hypothetical protein
MAAHAGLQNISIGTAALPSRFVALPRGLHIRCTTNRLPPENTPGQAPTEARGAVKGRAEPIAVTQQEPTEGGV